MLLLQTDDSLWQVLWHTQQSHTAPHDPRASIKVTYIDSRQVSLRDLCLHLISISGHSMPPFAYLKGPAHRE